MALWRAGEISADVLEVYREVSADDDRDPLAELNARGLPQPVLPDPLRQFYALARDYVLAMDHPGAAEVRAGLPADPGPVQPLVTGRNAVTEQWLAPALEALSKDHPALAQAIEAAADRLKWVTYDVYPRASIGEAFATGHAFASILGVASAFAAQDFELGLFLVAPHKVYRDHAHQAPELYAPLTGPHGWRFGPDQPLIVKPAHQPVWNPSLQSHLIKVGAVPFLSLFVWTKDVTVPAYVIAADDWADLESQPIV